MAEILADKRSLPKSLTYFRPFNRLLFSGISSWNTIRWNLVNGKYIFAVCRLMKWLKLKSSAEKWNLQFCLLLFSHKRSVVKDIFVCRNQRYSITLFNTESSFFSPTVQESEPFAPSYIMYLEHFCLLL